MTFKAGDAVEITCEGQTIDGTIDIISENQSAIGLSFEAILDGHVGNMPVLRDHDGTYRALMTNAPVAIKIKPKVMH